MKRKTIAYGLSVLLLLAQNSLVFAQTVAPTTSRSTDELVMMLAEPDVVAVVNVKKILSETAPSLLNKDAALLAKLSAAMKDIENETGIDPYSLDKIVFGMSLSTKADDYAIIIQSDSSAKLAEAFYQNQSNTAKLANEVNPLKEKLFTVKSRIESESTETTISINDFNAELDRQTAAALEFGNGLNGLRGSKINQTMIAQITKDAERVRQSLEKIRLDFNNRYKTPEFTTRLDKLEKQLNEITLSDNQRAAKIAAIGKELSVIDREAVNLRGALGYLQLASEGGINTLQNQTVFTTANEQLAKLPAAETARTTIYRSIQKDLAEMQKFLTALTVNINEPTTTEPPAEIPGPPVAEIYPYSTVITRKDETLDGKKLIAITTAEKFGGDREDRVKTNAIFQADDRTMMLGERQTIVDAINNKNADRNRVARDLIAKSSDALVALGVDLKTLDLRDTSPLLADQKNAWQAFGALSSQGNDLTLEAVVEKTDRPLVPKPKTGDEQPLAENIPIPRENGFAVELMDLLVKSVVGIEGKFTVRFEKKKAMAMLQDVPPILGRLINGKQIKQEKK